MEYYTAIAYFLSLMAIGNIMLLSLFTAILLQNFDEEPEDENENDDDKPKEKLTFKKIFS